MKFDVKIAKALLSFTLKYSKQELQSRTGFDMTTIDHYCAGKVTDIPEGNWAKLYPCLRSNLPDSDAYKPKRKPSVGGKMASRDESKSGDPVIPPATQSLDLPRISLKISDSGEKQAARSEKKDLLGRAGRRSKKEGKSLDRFGTRSQSDRPIADNNSDRLAKIFQVLGSDGRAHLMKTAEFLKELEHLRKRSR